MRNRYRLIMGLIPVILAFYLAMLPMNRTIEEEHVEIFPFFSWSLFSSVPSVNSSQYSLVLHAIDNNEVDGIRYLIPNDDVRDWKALNLVAEICRRNDPCDSEVVEIIYPIVWRLTGAETAEFSILEARVDLHDIQENIRDIVDQQANITDFFQSRTDIGRWNTRSGRIV